MKIGYKIVMVHDDGKLYSSTVNPKVLLQDNPNRRFIKEYGVGLITQEVSSDSPLFLFSTYEEAEHFKSFRLNGSFTYRIYKCVYTPSENNLKFISANVRDIDAWLRDRARMNQSWNDKYVPEGTVFAKAITLIQQV